MNARANTRKLALASAIALGSTFADAVESQQFQVNSQSAGTQGQPDAAFAPSGEFLVVYQNSRELPNGSIETTIWKRWFDAAGVPVEPDEYVGCVNNACAVPAVAIDESGTELILGASAQGTLVPRPGGGFLNLVEDSHRDIFVQRLDTGGRTVGPAIRVNTRSTNYEFGTTFHKRVAVGADGGFLVVWPERVDPSSSNSAKSIQARGFDASGVPRGPQVQVDPGPATVSGIDLPDVAALSSGLYVVVWHGSTRGTPPAPPQGVIVEPTALPVSDVFPLVTGLSHAHYPTVVADTGAEGGFAVVYERGSSSSPLYLRRFGGSGELVGVEVLVSQPGFPEPDLSYDDRPVLKSAPDGRLLAIWSTQFVGGGGIFDGNVQGRFLPPPDSDSDGVSDGEDNCPALANPAQEDADGDGIGDACDPHGPPDSDGDGALDAADLCPLVPHQDDARTACLLGGKFEVTGEMRDFAVPPETFPVKVMSFPSGRAETDQAVFFDAFQPGNFEVGIKMIDGCGFPEGHPLHNYWLFAGGLTNARAEVTVEDTVTGDVYTWANPSGSFPVSLGDTQAFACVPGVPSCNADANTACLLGDRFRVRGSMSNFDVPPLESPMGVMSFPALRAQSDQAVFFESFTPGSFEVGLKLVDACEGFPEGHPLRAYWAFYGGLTNAYTRISVRQIATGRIDQWISPAGNLPQSVGRTQAFSCD